MKEQDQAPTLAPLAFSVRDSSRVTGLSERTINTLIATKKLRSVKIGRRRLVPMDAIRELLEGAAA